MRATSLKEQEFHDTVRVQDGGSHLQKEYYYEEFNVFSEVHNGRSKSQVRVAGRNVFQGFNVNL